MDENVSKHLLTHLFNFVSILLYYIYLDDVL
jgi:hypothetical protein